MTSTATHTRPSDVLELVRSELGATPSLGQIVASMPGVTDALNRGRPVQGTAAIKNLLVTDPGLGPTRTASVHPGLIDTPLLAAVTGVDDSEAMVRPYSVSLDNHAAATPEGDELPESSITYTVGEAKPLALIGHTIPLTKQAATHNAKLQADVDAFLSGGLLVKLEALIATELASVTGTVAHPYTTDIATTIRTAIAAAQTSMRWLGPGTITVAMSPADHARLDLAGHDLAAWPAVVVSSPALADGTAYVGRLKLAAALYATRIATAVGYVNDQLIRNTATARATVEALAHIAAPGAIVKTATA